MSTAGSGVSIALGLVLAAAGCRDDSVTRPSGFCWMGVDSLYASNLAIADTSVVRMAFEKYIAFVDSSGGAFPDGETNWTFLTSRPFATWQGTFYWQVDHEASCQCGPIRLMRRLVYVDQNGVVVRPLGCF